MQWPTSLDYIMPCLWVYITIQLYYILITNKLSALHRNISTNDGSLISEKNPCFHNGIYFSKDVGVSFRANCISNVLIEKPMSNKLIDTVFINSS